MNRIQSKDHRIGTCEINKISLSWFDDKIHILNNSYDGIALGYYSYFDNYSKQLSIKLQKYYFNFRSNLEQLFCHVINLLDI